MGQRITSKLTGGNGAQRWSSYLATVSSSAAPNWLQAQWVLSQFVADCETAQAAYRRFVVEGMDVESPWQSLRGQIWLGGEDFRMRMSGLIAQRDLNAIPMEQTRPDRPTAEEVVSAVADAFEVAPEVVLDRSPQSAFKAAVYLLRRACHLPLTETTRLGGASPSRISRIQAELEKGERLETMETLCRRYKVKH